MYKIIYYDIFIGVYSFFCELRIKRGRVEDRESKREEEREIIHTRFWESSQTRTRERER